MPYNRIRKAYTRKPSAGVKPNLGHPLLQGLDHWLPFINSGKIDNVADPLNGTTRPLTNTSGIAWTDGSIRFNTTDLNSSAPLAASLADNAAAYTIIAKIKRHEPGTSGVEDTVFTLWAASSGARKILIRYDSATAKYEHYHSAALAGSISASVADAAKWHTLVVRWDGATVTQRVCGNGFRYDATHSVSTSMGSGDSTNPGWFSQGHAATDEGPFDAEYVAFSMEALSNGQIDEWINKPWEMYSRPLPIWIASGAAPPAWNNTMNEISAPGAVNEITNANIQSVNEI